MFHPFHRIPMFAFVGLGFLMFGTILAVACWLAFRSGKDGTTKLGGAAGCVISLALVFVAGLGALGCTVIGLINAPSEMIRRGPFRRIDAHWPDVHEDHDADTTAGSDAPRTPTDEVEPSGRGLHIRIEMAGGDATEVSRWFREHTDDDMTVSVDTVNGPDGPRTRIDIELPISESDLRDLRRDFQRDLPNLNLPDGISVELRTEDD